MADMKAHAVRLNEGIQVQEAQSCLLCNNEGVPLYQDLRDRLIDVPGVWTFLRCPACGLLWLNPCPTEDEARNLYTRMYCTHTLKEEKSRFAALRTKIENVILAKRYGYNDLLTAVQSSRWESKAFSLLVPFKEIVGANIMWLDQRSQGKLLDIGCGNGRFLAQMRELGWDVLGIEPDPIAASIAIKHFKLQVIVKKLEEANIPENSFYAITLRHVLEHVHEPVNLLRECYKVLAPGGILVVLTPSTDSLGHKIFKQEWSELDPPRHLYLFNHKTLINAAKLAGFSSSVKVRSTARAAKETWSPSISIHRTGKATAKSGFISKARFVFWALEEILRSLMDLQCGEELLLIASKEQSDD